MKRKVLELQHELLFAQSIKITNLEKENQTLKEENKQLTENYQNVKSELSGIKDRERIEQRQLEYLKKLEENTNNEIKNV